MLALEKAQTLAIVERGRSGWHLFVRDDRDGTNLEAPGSTDRDDFATFVERVVESHDVALGLIVIDRDGSLRDLEGVRFTGSVPAYVVSAERLVAAALEQPADRVVWLEADGAISASLLVRTATGHVTRAGRALRFEATRDGSNDLNEFLAFARTLGFERVVTTQRAGDERASELLAASCEARVEVVTPARLHAAARRHVLERDALDGVAVYGDGGGIALRMGVDRSISYVIEHTPVPLFAAGNDRLERALRDRECIFFADSAVRDVYGADVERYARERLRCLDVVWMDAGETLKTFERVREVCEAAIRSGIRRDGVFVGIGGGVLLDLIGTAASLYRRGIDFFRIPTTLVGMVDVCVGIKQGINFGGKKNFLGSFYPPIGGLNDRAFLSTLARDEISAGLAEIIKVAILLDPALFRLLEAHGRELLDGRFQRNPDVAEETLLRAEYAMMRELQPNLWERELRRFVDFGHTFSTVIETESDYRVSHGHAVALDMLVSTALAVEMGICSQELLGRLAELYRYVDLPLGHELVTVDRVLRAVAPMRLHRAGNLNLVVPAGVGRGAFVQDVHPATLRLALERLSRIEAAAGVAYGAGFAEIGAIA